jgi:hypothetical protein
MKLIFRQDLFLEDVIEAVQNKEVIESALRSWVAVCDGMEVIDGQIGEYIIHEDWCEEVEEEE